jgi:hypothetical protein
MSYANARRSTNGPLPSIPELWDLAKRMFQNLHAKVGAATAVAARRRFDRSERREVLSWLEPVGLLVRNLLFAQALTYLLMTPEGRKLRQETPRTPPPGPPAPVQPTTRSIRIPYPGWHTIAQHWRPEPEPPPEPAPISKSASLRDLADPASWTCSFQPMKFSAAALGYGVYRTEPKKPARPARRQQLSAMEKPHALQGPRIEPNAAGDADPHRGAFVMARRIEALARVIAKPRPAMLRLARQLASVPAETIALRIRGATLRNHWRHGNDCWEQSRDHCVLALRAFHRAFEAG